jgi:hypothetical protein
MVTGTPGTAATVAATAAPTAAGSRASAAPAPEPQTFRTGQAMLMSTIPAPARTAASAPRASTSGSEAKIWTANGTSAGSRSR